MKLRRKTYRTITDSYAIHIIVETFLLGKFRKSATLMYIWGQEELDYTPSNCNELFKVLPELEGLFDTAFYEQWPVQRFLAALEAQGFERSN